MYQLTDSYGNTYNFNSVGNIMLHGEFYELLDCGEEYVVVWCHEDGGIPSSFDELIERKSMLVDYRNGDRRFEGGNPDLIKVYSK